MKKLLSILSLVLLLTACSSVKRNQKLLAKGNYEKAIDLAVKKLQKDKVSQKKDAHIAILEQAFQKIIAKNTRRISFLEKQGYASGAKEIYYTFQNMEYIQDKIRPLLPLYSQALKRNTVFKLENYSDKILSAKQAYIAYLYDEAFLYMEYQTLKDYRTAYYIYCELEDLQPNYKDVPSKKENARFYGTNFILVALKNSTNQIIPSALEQELLKLDTYGLDKFWTQYHTQQQRDINYSHGITLNFRDIDVSPEKISETIERRSKRIKDGWRYEYDANGNVAKDSLGNDIKKDVYLRVSASITYITQSKSARVAATVIYTNTQTGRRLNRLPISSEFIFKNTFAGFTGDKRALTKEDRNFLKYNFIAFPSNEQMVFDTGEDLKLSLKDIIKKNTL